MIMPFRITTRILVHTYACNSRLDTSLLKKLTKLLTEILSKPQADSANNIPNTIQWKFQKLPNKSRNRVCARACA